jgi:hypothetical protein
LVVFISRIAFLPYDEPVHIRAGPGVKVVDEDLRLAPYLLALMAVNWRATNSSR